MGGSSGAEDWESEGAERGSEWESIFDGLTRPLLLRPLLFAPAFTPVLALFTPLLWGELMGTPLDGMELCIPKLTGPWVEPGPW